MGRISTTHPDAYPPKSTLHDHNLSQRDSNAHQNSTALRGSIVRLALDYTASYTHPQPRLTPNFWSKKREKSASYTLLAPLLAALLAALVRALLPF